jgi:hypothetical protein
VKPLAICTISTSLVLLLLPALAQAATVRGKVERMAGYPAAYVRVTLNLAGRRTSAVYTGSDGFYYVPKVQAGRCVLEIWNAKDKPTSFQIEVREPSTQVPTVKLP